MCAGLTPTTPAPLVPVIAVDGGGTRCRLVLDGAGARVAVEAGPANVTTDFDAAIGAVRAGLAALAAKAGMSAGDLAAIPAYLGLAGAADGALCGRVAAALPFARVRVEEDRAAALQGALGHRDGAIAHCGTGSFFGLRRGGTTVFVGGWGAKLGDEASSFWVGREALIGALAAVDGLRPKSPLADALVSRWGSPAGLVAFAADAGTEAIGALAPEVAEAAERGDGLGHDVLSRGAAHVAAMLDFLGWRPGLPICFTGGFAPRYGAFLPGRMRAALVAAEAAPIEGAVALARAFAAEAGA